MKTSFLATATAAALLAALALPLAASAATSATGAPQRYSFQTQYFDRFHAGEYDGLMALTVYPSGIVQGTYHDQSAGDIKMVTGGIDQQNRIWLDIGNGARALRLYGTFKDGALRTTANVPGPDVHVFQSVAMANQR
jgi:hypothetical protein